MALRVTQGLLYGSSVRGMNKTLNDLMESNLQATTQKRINRPSDDPAGAGRVISYRADLNTLVRYQSNVDQATGWLSTIDTTLAGNDGSVQAILTAIQGLELQGATGTVTGDNRAQIASSLRGFFDQLVNLANAKYNGNHVFAGHKTDQPAYAVGLGADCLDPNSANTNNIGYYNTADRNDPNNTYFKVTGSAKGTVLFQAVGSVGGNTPPDQVGADTAIWRCSTDGGKTWTENIPTTYDPATGQCEIAAAGVVVSFNLMDQSGNPKRVTLVDPDNPHSNDNGTWLYVRPAAIYQGDDNDGAHATPVYGAQAITPPATPRTVTSSGAVAATVTGTYRDPVDVEIISSDSGKIQYRYSTDGGTHWVESTVTGNPPSALAIPGGELALSGIPAAGDTFAVTATPTVPFDNTNSPTVEGYFTRDVAVRIDKVDGGQVTYSYSLDDGSNWTQATAPITSTNTPPTPNRLPVPGGYLNFNNVVPDAGSQFNVHPHRADIDLQIGDSSTITVNMVGKDIFGGLYNYHCEGLKTVPGPNMFETIGRLIAMAETGSQQGFQEAMGEMKEIMNLVVTKAAVAGGREDRLISTKAAISNQIYSQEEGLSSVEDIDITELMTRLAQQQVAYNAVLKSSSMIMQMSLVNFL